MKTDLNETILDISLEVVFLKYGENCNQDKKFNSDLALVFDFITQFLNPPPGIELNEP